MNWRLRLNALTAGPAWVLISFCIVGLVVWFVLTALGEMAAFFSMKKGFAGYATKYVHPALGYEDYGEYPHPFCR
jgi:amino acid permease